MEASSGSSAGKGDRLKAASLIAAAWMALAPTLGAAEPGLEDQARAVYADLVRAAGDDRPAPALLVATLKGGQVAQYDPDARIITVEPQALSVCAGFGRQAPAALAALLGHELAHFYLGHGTHADFGPVAAAVEGSPRLMAEREAQADRQAGVYACLAGYATAEALPDLLNALYHAYGLPEQMPGYPSLQQRRRQAAQAQERLAPARWAFEAGKRLLLLGRPQDAALAFDRAAQDFPSREVLCDAAVARLLAVKASLGAERFPWALPLPLDLRSRAAEPGTQVSLEGGDGAAQQRARWLAEAQAQLEKAALKAPDYAPAQLGLACLRLLQGQWELARIQGQALALPGAEPQAALGGRVVQALALALAGRRSDAATALEALDPAQPWVARNLAAMRPMDLDALSVGAALDPDEALAGWQPIVRATFKDADWAWVQLPAAAGEPLNLYHAQRAGVFAVRCVRGADETVAAVTLPSYGGQTAQGIKLGSDLAAVTKAYGQPLDAWPTLAGDYLLFRRIGFLIRHGQVAEWMLF